jgi:hypothetical protein
VQIWFRDIIYIDTCTRTRYRHVRLLRRLLGVRHHEQPTLVQEFADQDAQQDNHPDRPWRAVPPGVVGRRLICLAEHRLAFIARHTRSLLAGLAQRIPLLGILNRSPGALHIDASVDIIVRV